MLFIFLGFETVEKCCIKAVNIRSRCKYHRSSACWDLLQPIDSRDDQQLYISVSWC